MNSDLTRNSERIYPFPEGNSSLTPLQIIDSNGRTNLAFPSNSKISPHFLYEFYPGKSRFLCKGRCVAGPHSDLGTYACGWILTIVIVIFYGVFIAPVLWSNDYKLFPIISIILFVLTKFFLILCNCTDPGILPRRYILEIQGFVPKEFIFCSADQKEEQKKIYRYCETCHIYRPPKSTHCRFFLYIIAFSISF